MRDTSPFPGMDPYLETLWTDFHLRLLTYACDQLQPALPTDLRARIESRLLPRIRIREEDEGARARSTAGSTATVAEPVIVQLDAHPPTRSIEIVSARDNAQVLTVIELLSPANKRTGPGRDQYERKQRDCLAAGISLVEIDLVRDGRSVTRVWSDDLPPPRRQVYQAVIVRSWYPERAEVYPISLRAVLPALSIPLRKREAPATLALQPLVETAYRMGRYGASIDYTRPPHPPLDPDDAVWAVQRLRDEGRSSSQ